jgi:hypothetical protein
MTPIGSFQKYQHRLSMTSRVLARACCCMAPRLAEADWLICVSWLAVPAMRASPAIESMLPPR